MGPFATLVQRLMGRTCHYDDHSERTMVIPMAENTIVPGEVEAALEHLFEELNQSRQATLGELAAAHEQRAAQLAEAAKRLATVIGENSPRVLDLIDAADAATEQQTLFTMTLKRMDSLSAIKPPSPNQWLVLG